MSVISHLVWHDIRALRLPLVAWLLLLLAQAAVMAVGPAILDPESPRGAIQSLAGFLAGARLAFTILLTVLFIQRDSPVGTTAFWMTRPDTAGRDGREQADLGRRCSWSRCRPWSAGRCSRRSASRRATC